MSIVRPRSGSQGASENEVHYRVVVLGATGVGKSSIISQFLYDRFNAEYEQTVEELHRGHYNLGEFNLTLDILDTAGHREFPAMRKLAINTSDAFILVFSMTDITSFDEVQELRQDILSIRSEVPIVIVGNKSDADSEMVRLDTKTVESITCMDWESTFVQSSAKDKINIDGIFLEILNLSKLSCKSNPELLRRRMSLPSTLLTNCEFKKQTCTIS